MDRAHLQVLYLAVLAVMLLHGGAAHADAQDNEARQWLERMLQSARTLSYEGTFVYVQGQHVESMHIVHSHDEGVERQRMYSLNGPWREVIVADRQVICLLPKQQTSFNGSDYRRSLFPISLPRDLDELQDSYRFVILGDGRVAGEQAKIVAIEPRDRLRFGYRLWLDRDTGMVLRSMLFDEKGQVLEQMMFTDLQVKPHIDRKLLSASAYRGAAPEAGVGAEQVEHSDWKLADLPQGFMRVMHARFTKAPGGHPTEHIVLTDGLATVSVFLEPLAGSEPLLEGASKMGAMHAFGQIMHEHQVLVVGEVPRATVQRIASAVRYTRQDKAQ